MENLGLGLLATGLGAGAALLAVQARRAGRAREALRGDYFAECARLFPAPRIGRSGAGFPRLGGTYEGLEIDLQAVPDTLTFRKLPALWVMATQLAPLPLSATLDLMIRPTGIEPFSNFHTLPEQIEAPAGFPADCAIRTDNPEAIPPEALLRPFLGLFDDELVKELVISPRGLRIVFLAEEANRGRYLIFRDAEMGLTPLPAARLLPHLAGMGAMRAAILAHAAGGKGRETG
ncbi:MAG: hypothetical protein ACK5MQ_12870 [Pikeienuella sp.]